MYLKTKEGEWFKVSPYADSGADITILPKSVCEILGLRLQDGQESVVTGVGGFAKREDIPYLLGRTDILNHFNILFKKDKVVFIQLSILS